MPFSKSSFRKPQKIESGFTSSNRRKKRPPFRKKKPLGKEPGGPEDAISGVVERVTFHNTENGFSVLKVDVEEYGDCICVIGNIASISPGEWITAQGDWIRDREHGLQLKAHTLKTQPPTSLKGIEKYLGSGLIKGIGPIYATKLVKKFGEEVFDIIEHQSKRLEEIDGIGRERREAIKAAWSEQKVVRDIMLFLHAHGLSTQRATRIYRTYGDNAIETIRTNPYRLAKDIHGIGFHSADAVAAKLGFEPNSLLRARGALDHLLGEATAEGHCALPREELFAATMRLLDISREIVEEAFDRHLHDAQITITTIAGEEYVFLPHLSIAEELIARHLKQLANNPIIEPKIDPQKAIPWVEEKTGRKLSESQKQALSTALVHRAIIITGGPGVGKTTLVQSLLTILQAKKQRCLLAAPTGRAAQRLAEATGLEAKTIHRLLEFQPGKAGSGGFQRNIDNPLEADAVVIDEVSMVDVPLMSRLLLAHPTSARLILVGDVDQLPSVGPGLVLPDIIQSGILPVVHLTEIFRQAGNSHIIQAAHAINRGSLPPTVTEKTVSQTESDFFFIERTDPEQIMTTLEELLRERIPRKLSLNPIRDIQVLAPMHRGSLGVGELNHHLQQTLNPKSPQKPEYQAYGTLFRQGDKVLQTVNNYDKEVFNGDIGHIENIDLDEKLLLIQFEQRQVVYEFNELDELNLAYAITIHKSQGSEFPVVVMPLAMQQFLLLQRNLIYTGLTRGREFVILLGEKKALVTAVHNQSTHHRYSGLFYRLTNALAKK